MHNIITSNNKFVRNASKYEDLFVQEENLFSAMTPYALQANEQMFFFSSSLRFIENFFFLNRCVCVTKCTTLCRERKTENFRISYAISIPNVVRYFISFWMYICLATHFTEFSFFFFLFSSLISLNRL